MRKDDLRVKRKRRLLLAREGEAVADREEDALDARVAGHDVIEAHDGQLVLGAGP